MCFTLCRSIISWKILPPDIPTILQYHICQYDSGGACPFQQWVTHESSISGCLPDRRGWTLCAAAGVSGVALKAGEGIGLVAL